MVLHSFTFYFYLIIYVFFVIPPVINPAVPSSINYWLLSFSFFLQNMSTQFLRNNQKLSGHTYGYLPWSEEKRCLYLIFPEKHILNLFSRFSWHLIYFQTKRTSQEVLFVWLNLSFNDTDGCLYVFKQLNSSSHGTLRWFYFVNAYMQESWSLPFL